MNAQQRIVFFTDKYYHEYLYLRAKCRDNPDDKSLESQREAMSKEVLGGLAEAIVEALPDPKLQALVRAAYHAEYSPEEEVGGKPVLAHVVDGMLTSWGIAVCVFKRNDIDAAGIATWAEMVERIEALNKANAGFTFSVHVDNPNEPYWPPKDDRAQLVSNIYLAYMTKGRGKHIEKNSLVIPLEELAGRLGYREHKKP